MANNQARTIFYEELRLLLPELLEDARVDRQSFATCGGTSLAALQLQTACHRRGVELDFTHLLSEASLSEVINRAKVSTSDPITPDKMRHGDVACTASAPRSTKVSAAPRDEKGPTSQQSEDALSPPNGFVPKTAGRPRLRFLSYERTLLASTHDLDAEQDAAEFNDLQLRLIQGTIRRPGSGLIHHVMTARSEELESVQNAWEAVLKNEPTFNTAYRNPRGGRPLCLAVCWRRFETDDADTHQQALSDWRTALPSWPRSRDIDLDEVDLDIRFTVIELKDQAESMRNGAAVIWTIHHALIDGWSAHLLLQRVQGVRCGKAVCGPVHAWSTAMADLESYRQRHRSAGENFWSMCSEELNLSRGSILLPLPPASAFTKGSSYQRTEQLYTTLSDPLQSRIRLTSQRYGATPLAIFYAAWAITISVYSDSDAINFGTVVSARGLPIQGALDVVGPMFDTLPFHVVIPWTSTIETFVRQIHRRLRLLNEFSWTTPEHGFCRSFESLFSEHIDVHSLQEDNDVDSLFDVRTTDQITDIPLHVIVGPNGQLQMQYFVERYRATDMKRLWDHYQRVLVELVSDKHSSVMLVANSSQSTGSIAHLRTLGNCESPRTTWSSYGAGDDLVTLFEQTADRHFDAIALVKGKRQVSYSELDAWSSYVARRLGQMGVQSGEIITADADTAINWIVAIYAILRAGGVYCPIAPSLPPEARNTLFSDSGARIHLRTTSSRDATNGQDPPGAFVLSIEDMMPGFGTLGKQDVARRDRARTHDSAYVCFTSGSTGRPKGVVCTHGALVAFQREEEVRLYANPGVHIAQTMSPAFDGSIHEVFSALSYGATLVLPASGDRLGHLKLVDVAILTPSVASQLQPAEFPRLQKLYLVGEPVSQRVCDAWAAEKQVINMYGPTEATCGATIAHLDVGKPVTIGKPNPSTRVYILDHRLRLAPMGMIGEVWLAGVQVARGYLNQKELSSERFLDDSVCVSLGEQMYRTGDRGYWDENGDLVYCGRRDRQIKLRGFRLDLDDLEARIRVCCLGNATVAITLCDDVEEFVCMVQTTAMSAHQVRQRLQHCLPPYAVPRHIVVVERLPTTAAGKVDYKAIARTRTADREEALAETLDLQTSSTDQRLARLWQKMIGDRGRLNVTVTPRSRILNLGGDSVLQLRILSAINEEFGVQLSWRALAELDLSQMAREIDNNSGELQPSPRLDKSQLSSAEEYHWQRYQIDPTSATFNLGFACDFDLVSVNRDRLVSAWNAVLQHHEMFRCRYVPDADGNPRRILGSQPQQVADILDEPLEAERLMNTPFDLERDSPIRVVISRKGMVVVCHHISCDYTTFTLLIGGVMRAYDAMGTLQDSVSNASITSYLSATSWHPNVSASMVAFWNDALRGVPQIQPPLAGAATGLRNRTSYQGSATMLQATKSTSDRVEEVMKAYGVSGQQLALAAATVALAVLDENCDSFDVVIGVPFANRRSPEDGRVAAGVFLEPVPLRLAFPSGHHVSSVDSQSPLLGNVQSALWGAVTNAIPWDQLLRNLGICSTNLGHDHALFDCVVSFHDWRTGADSVYGKMAGIGMSPQFLWSSKGSKFKLMIELIVVDDGLL
ncbi:nonribosomal peptide synthase GliP-like protein, partial [Zymoseptoria brevis]